MTAVGMDAETVIPTFSPRYAFAAPKTTASNMPKTTDSTVASRGPRADVFISSTAREACG